jgi:hypothetical protein
MRVCSACGKEDRPWFENEPCNCGAGKRHEDDPSPLKHDPSCRCLGHEVIAYPVRMAESELTFDKKLPAYWIERKWQLRNNGGRFYRVKVLCRQCMLAEDQAQDRKRDYEKACAAARGQETQTYAQMLAAQTVF